MSAQHLAGFGVLSGSVLAAPISSIGTGAGLALPPSRILSQKSAARPFIHSKVSPALPRPASPAAGGILATLRLALRQGRTAEMFTGQARLGTLEVAAGGESLVHPSVLAPPVRSGGIRLKGPPAPKAAAPRDLRMGELIVLNGIGMSAPLLAGILLKAPLWGVLGMYVLPVPVILAYVGVLRLAGIPVKWPQVGFLRPPR
jgi:hypothetical protein